MQSCDTCPGNNDCTGTNLHPVLVQVLKLSSTGMTDKFDILFALSPENVALLEQFDSKVSPDCWSKAALLAIADEVTTLSAGLDSPDDLQDNFTDQTRAVLAMAVDSFEHFPWAVSELVKQAPPLYQAIIERTTEDAFADRISKRNFVKLCKDVAYR